MKKGRKGQRKFGRQQQQQQQGQGGRGQVDPNAGFRRACIKDITMGGAPAAAAAAAPRGRQNRRQQRNQMKVIGNVSGPIGRVTIRNYGTAQLTAVVDWIRDEAGKASQTINIVEATLDSTTRTITLRLAEADIMKVRHLCDSMPFRGQRLEVRQVGGAGGAPGMQRHDNSALEATFEGLIGSGWNPQSCSLNLQNIAGRYGTRAIDWNSQVTGRALCAAMQRKCTGCKELFLDENGIEHLIGLRGLAQACPTIVHLSLTGNRIANFEELTGVSSLRLKKLALNGNPVKTSFDRQTVQNEIYRLFPGLLFLDDDEVVPLMRFKLGASQLLDVLPPIAPSSFQSPQLRDFAMSLVGAYFDVFNRSIRDANTLRMMYAEGSFFSVSLSGPITSNPDWRARDRNIVRSSKSEVGDRALVTTIAKGKEEIVRAICDLPECTVPLDKLVCDCFEVPGISGVPHACIALYGTIVVVKGGAEFSFDRVLVARPGPPTEIVNDHLHIDRFTGTHVGLIAADAFAAANATPAAAPVGTTGAPTAVSPLAPQPISRTATTLGPETPQHEMVARFMQETRLKQQVAEQALVGNMWDYTRALADVRNLFSLGKITSDMLS